MAYNRTPFRNSCDVRFGSKADICTAKRHVRFTPNSGHRAPLIRSPQLERVVSKLSELMAEVHVQAAGRMSEPEPILERHRAKAGLGAQRQ